MTRSYTLDNWDGNLSTFEAQLPESALMSVCDLPILKSIVDESMNYGHSKSRHSVDDASNKPHTFEKTRLFDLSDTDLGLDIVMDAPNPFSSLTGTPRSPLSPIPLNPEIFVPSPALTVQSLSTYTADAYGEDDDCGVIIVDDSEPSFPLQDGPSDEASASASHNSLFTPPPSEAAAPPSSSESPPSLIHEKKSRTRTVSSAPHKTKTLLSHVLVPSLAKPRSEYVKMSSPGRPTAGKRPNRTSVWKNNYQLDWLDEHDVEEDETRRKKRKRKHKDPEGMSHPIAGPSTLSHNDDEESVVFVNRPRRVKATPASTDNAFIDLTLDDDEVKPSHLLSEASESVLRVIEVPSPIRQPALEETRIRIGVVHSISFRTLLFNTRFLRGAKGCTVPSSDSQKDFVGLNSLLPSRRRRALLDDNSEGSSSLDEEFSLGDPVVTESGQKTIDEDYENHPGDEAIECSSSFSEHSVVKHVVPSSLQLKEPSVPPPKIDLAAKIRKKKTAAARQTSFVLTPTSKVVPVQPSSTFKSRSPVFLSRSYGPVQEVVLDDDNHSSSTPLVPSAKALGKLKAADSALQTIRPLSPLPPPITTSDNFLPAHANNFDLYINFRSPSPLRSTTLTSDNPPFHLSGWAPSGYPDQYLNSTLPSSVPDINVVDHRHHHPGLAFSNVEPAASLLCPSDDYIATNDFDRFTSSVLDDPPPSSFFSLWPPELETGFPYDNATVNPSLLDGGDTLGMLGPPESSFPFSDAGDEFFDAEAGTHSAMSRMSPSRSPTTSPKTLPSSSKSKISTSVHLRKEADSEITVKPRQPPVNDIPAHEEHPRRHRVKRSMPDMVPLSELGLSSDSEPESGDDVSAPAIIAPKPRRVHLNFTNSAQSRKESRPTATREPAASLLAGSKTAGPKVMVGGQHWPMQDVASYCHQCRNKTMVLKIECCRCPKFFCVRCLTVRYPDEPRALQMEETGCPSCLAYCNCTSCCKKRGVEYVSTKDAMASGVVSRAQAVPKKPKTSLGISSSFSSPAPVLVPPTPSPLLSSTLTPAEGVYWGTIYGADGSKIGAGFRFAKRDAFRERTPAVSTKAIPKAAPRNKKRVYVGKIHPSWQLDNAVKKSVLEPVPPPKRVHESRRPRKYVGNKAFLFYKSERMARELADLSPLSSLEDDWNEDDEDDGEMTEWDSTLVVEKDGGDVDQVSQRDLKDESVFSMKSLNDYDVMRAIGLSLHACGIQFAG